MLPVDKGNADLRLPASRDLSGPKQKLCDGITDASSPVGEMLVHQEKAP
jgi:hypothetical protein